MKLTDVIALLLGSTKDDLASQKGFDVREDSTGVLLFMAPAQYNELKNGQGTGLAQVQLITLRMLEEQSLADSIPNGYRLTSDTVARLEDDQAELLRLGSRFPGTFTTDTKGRTGHPAFRVDIHAVVDGRPTPYKLKGPYLSLSGTEKYRLTAPELLAFSGLERHQQLTADDRSENANLQLIAELQLAKRSGMAIDLRHFDKLEVEKPEHVGVTATRLPDGSLQLSPSLGEGTTPDQLAKRWTQLDLDSDSGVLRVGNRIVLLEEEKIKAVREVLANRRISKEQVDEFYRTPSAFLDAALVNLELGFSVRVEGIGKLVHMDFGANEGDRPDWFALDKLPLPPQHIPNIVKSEEDIARFEEVAQAAWGQGATTMVFDEQQIDITDKEGVAEQLSAARESIHRPKPEPKEQEETEDSRVGLIIKEVEGSHNELLELAKSHSTSHTPDWDQLARTPFPHQVDGIQWIINLLSAAISGGKEDMYRLQGALLADDMGLGKTFMSLVAAAEYFTMQSANNQQKKPILVVAPLSLLENWADEVDSTFKTSPFKDTVILQSGHSLKDYRVKGVNRESSQVAALEEGEVLNEDAVRYALYIGPDAGTKRLDREQRLVITTYQTLRDYQFSLCRIDWGMVIFDEAQNIKNPNALQTRAAKGLRADFKLLATGTPVENSLGDFWCLMDTAQPGLLGNWAYFRDEWIKPIQSCEGDERDSIRAELGQQLRDAVGPFMLRRVKEDQLKGLPAKHIRCGVPVTANGVYSHAPELGKSMTGSQLSRYDDILAEYRKDQATEDMRGRALAVLQQLREASLHPRLRNEAELYSANAKQAKAFMSESGKLTILLAQLEAIRARDEKVILFMVTKKLQRLLKLWLDQIFQLDVAIINGDTSAVPKKKDVLSRKQLIKQFEATEGFNIIIMSPVAAGVGLTVVEANHVVHLERHWNPAKEAQASDRVYRIGQQREVFVHLPAVFHPEFDSFDVHLDRLLRGKLMLKDAVVTPEVVSEEEVMQAMGL
jgi:SNF2 family DNA or RNA helicase